MLTLVDPIPLNTYSWTLGWIVVWLFAFKSYKHYRRTKNPLAKYYSIIALLMGTSFFFFGVPNAFSDDPDQLLKTYYVADIFAQLGMLAQARLLWFIGLKNKVNWWVVAIPTMMLSSVILWTEFQYSWVVIDASVPLVRYMDAPITYYLKCLIYLLIAYPIGYFLIRQGIRQSAVKARMTSVAAGIVFIGIATSSIQNALMTGGSDTKQTVIQNILIFSTFQIISSTWSWRQRRQARQAIA